MSIDQLDFSFVKDSFLRKELEDYWFQAQKAYDAGA
jgi:hypothetical protein